MPRKTKPLEIERRYEPDPDRIIDALVFLLTHEATNDTARPRTAPQDDHNAAPPDLQGVAPRRLNEETTDV